MQTKNIQQILVDFDLMFRENTIFPEYIAADSEEKIYIQNKEDLASLLYTGVFLMFKISPELINFTCDFFESRFKKLLNNGVSPIEIAETIHENISSFNSSHEEDYQPIYALFAKYMSPLFVNNKHLNFIELFLDKKINKIFLNELHLSGAELSCSNSSIFKSSLIEAETLSKIGYKYNHDFFNYFFYQVGIHNPEYTICSLPNLTFHLSKIKEQNLFKFYIDGTHILIKALEYNNESIFHIISPKELYESFSDHTSFMNVFTTKTTLTSYLFIPFLSRDEQLSLFKKDYNLFLSFIQKNSFFYTQIFQTVINSHKTSLKNTDTSLFSDELKKTIDYKTILLLELSYPSLLDNCTNNITKNDFICFKEFLSLLNHTQKLQKSFNIYHFVFDTNNFIKNFSFQDIFFLKNNLETQNLDLNDFFISMKKTNVVENNFLQLSYNIFTDEFEKLCLETIYSSDFLQKQKDISYFYSDYNTTNNIIVNKTHPVFSKTQLLTTNIMDYVIYHKDNLIYPENIALINQIFVTQETVTNIKNTTTCIDNINNDISISNINEMSDLINENFNCDINDFLHSQRKKTYKVLFLEEEKNTNFETIIAEGRYLSTLYYLHCFGKSNALLSSDDDIINHISDDLLKEKNYYDYLSFFDITVNNKIPSSHPHAQDGYSDNFNLLIDNFNLLDTNISPFKFYNLFQLDEDHIYFVIHNVLIYEHKPAQFSRELYLSLNLDQRLSEQQLEKLNNEYSTSEIIDALISGHQLKIYDLAKSFFDNAFSIFKSYYKLKFIKNIDIEDELDKLVEIISNMSIINKLFFKAFFVFIDLEKKYKEQFTKCMIVFRLVHYSSNDNQLSTITQLNTKYLTPYYESPFLKENTEDTEPILEENQALLYSTNNLSLYLSENSMNTNEIFVKYKKLLDKKQSQVLRLVTSKDLLQNIDILYQRFPHFEEVITYIEDMLRLSTKGDNTFYIPPSLLLGGAGVGKTFFVHTICNIIKTHFVPLNTQSITAGFVLHGSDQTWSSANVGIIFRSLFHSKEQTMNPIFLLDEIDKAGGDYRYSVANSLLPVLERYTAKNYKDECLPLPIDASNISWFATANALNTISFPLLSRFEIFTIPNPNVLQKGILAENVYQSILLNNSWGQFFNQKLPEETKQILALDLGNGGARDLRKTITLACAQAIKNNTNELTPHFFNINTDKQLPWDL